MKRTLLISSAMLAMMASHTVLASPELAKAKNCMACHAPANKLVGPSYKDIASKYAGQKDAESMLAQKIIKGGSGNWGAIPMPANAQVSDAEARTLVRWILGQK